MRKRAPFCGVISNDEGLNKKGRCHEAQRHQGILSKTVVNQVYIYSHFKIFMIPWCFGVFFFKPKVNKELFTHYKLFENPSGSSRLVGVCLSDSTTSSRFFLYAYSRITIPNITNGILRICPMFKIISASNVT